MDRCRPSHPLTRAQARFPTARADYSRLLDLAERECVDMARLNDVANRLNEAFDDVFDLLASPRNWSSTRFEREEAPRG